MNTHEMFFYQDMPIKFPGQSTPVHEERLNCFDKMIGTICCDFVAEFGLNAFMDCYVYISAKRLFVNPGRPYNRPGYHTDGYMSEDINYIWYDRDPTVFNLGEFKLSKDHDLSMKEMEAQSIPQNEFQFPRFTILRLNEECVHKVGDVLTPGIRTFLKLTFSGDKFNLSGNTHNYALNYNWEMRPRSVNRNVPQEEKEPDYEGPITAPDAFAGGFCDNC